MFKRNSLLPCMPFLCGVCFTAGPKAAGKNAVIGGLVLAMIEGASIAITKVRSGRIYHHHHHHHQIEGANLLNRYCYSPSISVLRSSSIDP